LRKTEKKTIGPAKILTENVENPRQERDQIFSGDQPLNAELNDVSEIS
jgi:hypothetical protein